MRNRLIAVIAATGCVIVGWIIVNSFSDHSGIPNSMQSDPFVNGESGFPQPDLPPAKGFVATLGDGGPEPLAVKSTGPIAVSCRVSLPTEYEQVAITASILRNTERGWIGTGAMWAGTAGKNQAIAISTGQPRRDENTPEDAEYALVVLDYAGYEIGRRALKFE